MTDIVDRLSGLAHALRKDGKQMTGHEVKEAADEIERLRAERDEAQAEANAGRQAEHDADLERRAVESERDRLREALQHVILWVEQYANPQAILPYNTKAARAALKETGHD
jgi:chromosome segregation ATPase